MTAAEGQSFRDGWYTSQDNLRLYYRDYGNPTATATPVLCLAGLTRNSRDFHELASLLSEKRRVLAPDYRGRGRSEADPKSANYIPPTYVQDVGHLLTVTNCHHAVVIGTSLGGVVAMALGAARPTALAGVVLNDVGPEIDRDGLDRIRGYVGREQVPADHEAGARLLAEMMGQAYPDFTEQDWLAESRARYRRRDDGALMLEYDPNIAMPLNSSAGETITLWPLFRSLANIPVLAIRGERSDILGQAIFDQMLTEKPDMVRVTVPERGHVPLLTEAVCVAAIETFLEAIDRPDD